MRCGSECRNAGETHRRDRGHECYVHWPARPHGHALLVPADATHYDAYLSPFFALALSFLFAINVLLPCSSHPEPRHIFLFQQLVLFQIASSIILTRGVHWQYYCNSFSFVCVDSFLDEKVSFFHDTFSL